MLIRLVLNNEKTIAEITIENIPVGEPERNTAIVITVELTVAKYLSTAFDFTSINNPIGNPIAKTAAKPAGLSKLPVIANLE